MLTVAGILQVHRITGVPVLLAAENILNVTQNDPGSWILHIPAAPEGFTWVANVTSQNPRQLSNGTNITVNVSPTEIEITTDDGPVDDAVLYIQAQLIRLNPVGP